MKVTVDISSIPYGRGVSRYTSNLVRALKKQEDVQLQVFGSSLRQTEELTKFVQEEKIKQSQIWNLPPKFTTAWWYDFPLISPEAFIKNTDVFHAWEELIPPIKNAPVVATIHDLAMLEFPETAHPDTLYKHSQGWKRLKESNSHIIAVSKATHDDIVEKLEIPDQRVHLVYEALPEEHKFSLTETQLNQVKTTFNLDKPFLLFVGTQEPRKNLTRLIQAWQPMAKEIDLVIAGEYGWGDEENRGTSFERKPTYLGRVSNIELACLYSLAEVFVYPSLYEGFGLPILESFYYKTPVVTSNVSSMPEVGGNAAKQVNPLDPESITRGIEHILSETKAQQTQRQNQMKLRLLLFSWYKTAEKTISVYQKAINDFK